MEKFYVIDEDTKSRIEKLENELLQIKTILLKPPESKPVLEDWVMEEQAMRLLQKGKTSLYYLRTSGELIATDTRPIFYSLKSIQQYLNNLKK